MFSLLAMAGDLGAVSGLELLAVSLRTPGIILGSA